MNFSDFIKLSPTPFHVTKNITDILKDKDYVELHENEKWKIEEDTNYFVTRNSSSVIAFKTAKKNVFNICASHSDSPCFKIKPISTLQSNGYTRLNTEAYGGFNSNLWFDRPLSVAGRIIINNNSGFDEKLIHFSDMHCIIPSLAIHLNRESDNATKIDKQNDLLPIISISDNDNFFIDEIASCASCNKTDILSAELFLVSNETPKVWGNNSEFISAPRIDDLLCCYSSLNGFVESESESENINVFCCFDNEEVGSETKQGAQSNFLSSVIERICTSRNLSHEDYLIAVADSFLVSADNGHAVHPAHPEKTDPKNSCCLNGGVVIKYNSNQRYMSDAVSIAKAVSICKNNGIPYQMFANNSNIPGGSTLGNLTTSNLSIKGVDIGAAQLSMHSPFETAGTNDIQYLTKFFSAFYGE